MSRSPAHHGLRSGTVLLLFLVICYGVAAFGAQFLPGPWYAGLNKPAWTPPSALFAPVWSLLYGLMAVAGWRVWRAGRGPWRIALVLFGLQLMWNGLWSWLFFGERAILAALVDIGLLWVTLAAAAWVFFRVDRVAGWLWVPYLAWVTYAASLNGAIWYLNR